MTEYIILSPTIAQAYYYYHYTYELLLPIIIRHSRRAITIETNDVKLWFMSEEIYQKKAYIGQRATVIVDTQFERLMDEYIATSKMIRVGDVVEFDAFRGIRPVGFKTEAVQIVTGTVSYINEKHKWFSVDYELGGTPQKTSFKLVDVGELVKIVNKKEKKK